jgi:CRP-like cAMP-binding protein
MAQRAPSNALIALLAVEDRAKMRPYFEELDVEVRHGVFEADVPIQHVYFPLSCVISVHTEMRDGTAVEIVAVGREGVVGLPVFLGGDQTPATAFCQVPGRSLRMEANAFRAAVAINPVLNTLLLRYTQALLTHVSQSAACNRVHPVEERCARWLLTTHDSVGGESFELTQEFLAEMLGVRRPRVSVAASILQRAGFIRYSRGRVQVVDRAGLESAACECYGVITREYTRLFALEEESNER